MNIRVDDSRTLDCPGGFGPRLQTNTVGFSQPDSTPSMITSFASLSSLRISLFLCPSLLENLTSLNQRYSSSRFPVSCMSLIFCLSSLGLTGSPSSCFALHHYVDLCRTSYPPQVNPVQSSTAVALALCSREAGVVQQYVMRRWQEFADERTASESSESTPFL
jgi:hypothetical protein